MQPWPVVYTDSGLQHRGCRYRLDDKQRVFKLGMSQVKTCLIFCRMKIVFIFMHAITKSAFRDLGSNWREEEKQVCTNYSIKLQPKQVSELQTDIYQLDRMRYLKSMYVTGGQFFKFH